MRPPPLARWQRRDQNPEGSARSRSGGEISAADFAPAAGQRARPARTNVGRRAWGLVTAATPFAVAVASWFSSVVPFPHARRLALVLLSLAVLLGCLNFLLSFVRLPFLRKRRVDGKVPRRASGIPGVGTVFCLSGLLVGFGDKTAAVAGFLAALVDTGGLPWIVARTWRDASLWDSKAGKI